MAPTDEISGTIANTIVVANTTPDHTHPLFLHIFYSPGMNLVNSSFNEKAIEAGEGQF